MSILLKQALASNDSDTLKFVFSNSDVQLINLTVTELPLQILEKLITVMTDRLEHYPMETTALLRWLDVII